MDTYERFSKIIGKDLLKVVERSLGGRAIYIRKYSERPDVSQFIGKPITNVILAKLLHCSTRQVIRIKQNFLKK